jgi:hypothetical protein
MIIIVDDTFNERHKYNDVSYLCFDNYKQVCKVYEKPFNTELRTIVEELSNCNLFCNHRTLKIINIQGIELKSDEITEIKRNLFHKISSLNIPRIEFSRDLHTNIEAKTIDKNLFYTNLKSFLDFYIVNHIIELKILFYGENFTDIEKLTLVDKIIDEILKVDFSEFKSNQLIINGLNIIFPNKTAELIIDIWFKKEFSKKEIIQFINENI